LHKLDGYVLTLMETTTDPSKDQLFDEILVTLLKVERVMPKKAVKTYPDRFPMAQTMLRM